MTLLELLVQELPKRGGWPEGAVECCRHVGMNGIEFYDSTGNWPVNCNLKYGKNFAINAEYKHCLESVTRAQYEAALADAQQPVWDGEGMPPVGCECELFDSESGWETVVIKFIGNKTAVVDTEDGEEYSFELSTCDFRPILSEADKKRDEAKHAIAELCRSSASNGHSADLIYDAIAAGKIPGVRLEGK